MTECTPIGFTPEGGLTVIAERLVFPCLYAGIIDGDAVYAVVHFSHEGSPVYVEKGGKRYRLLAVQPGTPWPVIEPEPEPEVKK